MEIVLQCEMAVAVSVTARVSASVSVNMTIVETIECGSGRDSQWQWASSPAEPSHTVDSNGVLLPSLHSTS